MYECNADILNRKTPVALKAFILTLRKASDYEGSRMSHPHICWLTDFHLEYLDKVQDALKAEAITPREAAAQTMHHIGEWLDDVFSTDCDFRCEMDAEKRRDMSKEDAARLDSLEREMQWCWKQGEKFAENSHWLGLNKGNPQAMIECGQNPWKPSTMTPYGK